MYNTIAYIQSNNYTQETFDRKHSVLWKIK